MSDYLWMYVIIMSRAIFRVNPHSVVHSECQGTTWSKQATSMSLKVWVHSETGTWHDNNI